MHRYIIQEKPFAFGNKFIITDEQNHEAFIAKGKPFSFEKRTKLFDSFDNVAYEFYKEFFSWKKVFFIERNGVRAFRLFRDRISIPPEIFIESLEDSDAYYVRGNFWGREYEFFKGEKLLAKVTKKFPAFSDTYSVSINEGNDDALIISAVIIIDLMKAKKKRS